MVNYKEIKDKSYHPHVSSVERAKEDKRKVSKFKSPKLNNKYRGVFSSIKLELYANSKSQLMSMRDDICKSKGLLPGDFKYVGKK